MRSALRRLVTLTGLSTAGPAGDDITLRRQRMVRHNEPNEVQSLMLWASIRAMRAALRGEGSRRPCSCNPVPSRVDMGNSSRIAVRKKLATAEGEDWLERSRTGLEAAQAPSAQIGTSCPDLSGATHNPGSEELASLA